VLHDDWCQAPVRACTCNPDIELHVAPTRAVWRKSTHNDRKRRAEIKRGMN